MLTRRHFLKAAAIAPMAPGAIAGKAPYRLLYSNDLTNVAGCLSPFHHAGEPFRPAQLEASIDEVANHGVDVHLLQPGLGAVPLWPSKVYPLEPHYRWIQETYGVGPDSFGKFVLGGGDVIQLFVNRCRLRGQAPFVSFRLNDAHHKEHVNARRGDKITTGIGLSLTPFYRDHPEWRIGQDPRSASQLVLDWAVPEVRARVFSLIQELCENYDLDGLELDFLRYLSFFRTTLPVEARRKIITGFVKEVRALLDRTMRAGRHRWLSVRIPCFLGAFDRLGLDLPGLVTAGVEMVNVSPYYFTMQQTDFAAIRRQVPDAAAYLEMCHTTWTGERIAAGYDAVLFRRTTPEQFETTAHLAYAQGANGMSLFNFAYYREHGAAGRGPFSEPPFATLPHLIDRDWLAKQPQHYFLAPGWRDTNLTKPLLPRVLKAGETASFPWEMAPPAGGWQHGGRLRAQAAQAWAGALVTAKLNGLDLAPSDDISEPFPNPSPSLLGKPEELRAWLVPANALKAGTNILELSLTSGSETQIVVLDARLA